MPLIGLAPGFGNRPAANPYGDKSRGIGNPNTPGPSRPVFSTRHPEGSYIPLGRGIYDKARAAAEKRPVRVLPQQIDRRDIVPVTMGSPISKPGPSITPRPVIPKLVVPTVVRSPVKSAPVVRASPVPKKEPAIPTIQTKVPKMGLDLGNLLNTGLDLYAKYQTIKSPTRVAPTVQVAAAAPQTYWPQGYGVEQMAGPQFIANTPGSGILDNPFGELIAQPPDEALADGMKGWSYKKSCGEWKWVKSGRRRRRKLLTDSDYNGLLKLQTLKVNSNMNIAIAKSIGR